MPRIHRYICKHCGFILHNGLENCFYIINDESKVILAPHPGEISIVKRELGCSMFDLPKHKTYQGRFGWKHFVICTDCLNKFELDLEKENRICKKCESLSIYTCQEMVNKLCPKCGQSKIKEIDTGLMS